MIARNVSRDTLLSIPLDSIETNPHQPRKIFDSGSLAEAQQRIDNAVAVRQHLLSKLAGIP